MTPDAFTAMGEEMNQRALQAEKLTAATMLDKVKIQFSLAGLQATQASGRPVFAAHLPETVLRLQRREFFRLPTPIANPLKCRTTLRIDGEAAQDLDINLLDISGGGVGLMMPTTFQGKLPVGTSRPRSRTATLRPARASRQAETPPPKPEPMTMAS